jgi:NADH:ubiquinone oxidoreductase subunit 4 (subunit M)
MIPSAHALRLWANGVGVLGVLPFSAAGVGFRSGRGRSVREQAPSIPTPGAGYHIGIDGLGLPLVLLTTLPGWISILSRWNAIRERL